MATTVTVKGQVTIPKAVRDAAGIKPGDRVEMRKTPEGVLIRLSPKADEQKGSNFVAEVERRLSAHRSAGIVPRLSTDEVMALTRGDD